MTSTPQPAIEAVNVTKRYPKARRWREIVAHPAQREWTEALRGVSLSVPRGTVQGLLGANGAGKTTLLKVLATLVLPTTGSARVAGFDVSTQAHAVRARLGVVVAEERSFQWRLSGRDNLLFFAALQDVPASRRRARVEELLGIVGLTKDAARPFREYSTGMRQRLAIARGLLAEPEVLLLDEPTRGLDPPAATWMREFVREELARARKTTVLLATHDMLEAETTCDRLALVASGLIVAEGTPSELKTPLDAAGQTVITLHRPAPQLLARVESGLLGAPMVARHAREDGLDVIVQGGPEQVSACVRTLVEAGGSIVAVRPEEGSLARLFERVVGAQATRSDRAAAAS